MILRSRLSGSLLILCLVFLVACSGGGSTNPPPQGSTAPVSVTLTDTPPAGVTILSFEVQITGAVLQPGNVPLVTSPIEIEVKHLEIEAAFLNTINVPAGTYTSIQISFANPEVTFKNDTGATIAGCAAGAVCEIQPNVSGSFTFSGAPFPLTIQANTPIGLLVDVNLNNIIQSNLGLSFAANAFTVTQLPPLGPTGELEEIELTGTVANKGTNQFTLQTTHGDFAVQVNANTEFEDFDEEAACAANNFTCVQNGQVVEVEFMLMAGGTFVAKEIEFEDDAVDDELDGIITSVDSPTQFKLVVIDELRNLANVDVGSPVTVTLGVGTQFRVDDDGLTVPSVPKTLFESAVDTSQLLPGQTVQIRLTGAPGSNVTVDRIRLRGTRFTATVATVTSPNFVVNNLPSLFTAAGVSQIQVQTSSQTDFEGVAGVASLQSSNVVSLRGLLFKDAPDPILVAKKVRKR